MNLKNIVTVCDGSSITGGTEKVAIVSAIGLSNRGFNSAFFGGEGNLEPALEQAGVRAETLGLTDAYHTESKLELLRRFFWNKSAAEKFRDFINTYNPSETIVHVHGFRRVLSGSVIKVAKELGFKVIFTLHDFGLSCPNTSLYQFPEEKICHLKPLSVKCFCTQCTHSGWPMKAMQMGRGMALQLHSIAKDFDGMIAVSTFSKNIFEQFLTEKPIVVIQNPASQVKEPKSSPGDYDVVTYVGRLSPEKGVTLLARAARRVGIKCRFVGSGPEESALREIDHDIEITGWVDSSEVNKHITGSRCVVLPSKWYETAGLAVIEAISRGIPAIVSDTCAATEYVLDGFNGMHFRNQDVKDLAWKIKQMTPECANQLGANGYQSYWASPLTEDKYFDSLLEYYQSILAQ
jgi:glycosyltransferase involved in cell wall biosynthesis